MKRNIFCVLLSGFFAVASWSYDFKAGEMILRPVVGAQVNVVKFNSPGEESPGAGMLLGVEFDYLFDGNWSFGGALKPAFSAGYSNLILAATGKYRITQFDTPFIPYASLGVTFGFLFPPEHQAMHFNLGIRPALGLEYFVLQNLGVGLEFGIVPSGMFTQTSKAFELGVEAILGVSWVI